MQSLYVYTDKQYQISRTANRNVIFYTQVAMGTKHVRKSPSIESGVGRNTTKKAKVLNVALCTQNPTRAKFGFTSFG